MNAKLMNKYSMKFNLYAWGGHSMKVCQISFNRKGAQLKLIFIFL